MSAVAEAVDNPAGMEAGNPYQQENVRKGAWHYLLGRGAAGVAGFAIVLLLVRFMDVANYAAFTALSGLVAVCGIVAGLGMERVVSRYIPEGRLHRRVGELRNFIWCVSGLRLVACFVVAGLFWLAWPVVSRWLAVSQYGAFAPCVAWFIVAETMFQHFSAVLQALVMQKTLTRLLVIQWGGRLAVLAAVLLLIDPVLTWQQVFWLFTIPELLGVVAFALAVHLHLRALEKDGPRNAGASGSWPEWRKVGAVGFHNFGFTLLAAPPQGYFMKMLTAAFLPAEAVAAYGFFISVAEKVRQYVPMYFFYGLLEPVMIASYLKDGDFDALAKRCSLLYKTNLLLMALAIACAAAGGENVLAVLTGGKFHGLSWILPLVLVQLTIGSHVVLLQLLLNSVEYSAALIRASIIALPIMACGVGLAIWLAPMALLFTPILFSLAMNACIIAALGKRQYRYRPSWRMLSGVVYSGLFACAAGWGAARMLPAGLAPIVTAAIVCAVACAVYLLALIMLKTIDKSEIALVRSLIKK
jgi:pyruvyl transferase EpsO